MQFVLLRIIGAYQLVLIAYVILAWVPRPPDALHGAVVLIRKLVDPVLQPLRRVLPPLRIGGAALDVSIIVLFVVLNLLQLAIVRIG